MKRIVAAVAALGALLTAVLVTAPVASAKATQTGVISMVHGLPGVVANIFVDGKLAMRDFQPWTIRGPVTLPAGSHKVQIFPSSNTAGMGTPLLSGTMVVGAGTNNTWVAHTDQNNKPVFTSYLNPAATLSAGDARLIMRHDAVVGAVDILANGQATLKDVAYGQQATVDVPAGTVTASVVNAGTTTKIAGPLPLSLPAKTTTIVYGVGSLTAGTLSVVVQRVSADSAAPTGVPAGTGGFEAFGGTPLWVWALSIGGLLVAMSGAVGTGRAYRLRRTALDRGYRA